MKTYRITTIAVLLRNWDFFQEGFVTIRKFSNESLDDEAVFKTMMYLVKDPVSSWVGLTFDDDGVPLAFGVGQECTPRFDPVRRFVVRWFFHTPSQFAASVHLMNTFESWAREHGIASYAVTTRRDSGSAIRCFQSNKYGFKRSFLTFEKYLT